MTGKRVYKAGNCWFDPDIVRVESRIKDYGSFWENYDECHFPDGRVICIRKNETR